ncbi:MAG: carbon-nitrogen hydrolase family protein [Spirochaetales bacterium]|nr:carbon-nitrogen hydrolase family protein [Spirochaetales bacterium]
MNKKEWIRNGLYLVVAFIAFSLSLFKFDNPVWITAWIAPVFLLRFMRNSKWILAVISGYIVLQIAVFTGILPMMTMMDTTSIKADFSFMLMMQARSGMLFLPLSFLVPFILDKALNKYLPKFAASLIYPTGVVAVELLNSLIFGTLNTFGESQFVLPPLVMTSSLFGFFGVSFLVAWFASMINYLWEENWNIKKNGYSVLIYIGIMTVMLIYGGIALAFPKRAEKNVLIAGITLENGFFTRMADSGLYVTEIFTLHPAEIAELMSSPQSHLDEIRQKTLEAIETGARIIVLQEYALSLESSFADSYLLQMKNLADEKDVYLLVSYARLLNQNERNDRVMKNVSILFTPEGTVGWEYNKAFPATGYEDVMVEAGPENIPYIDTPYGRIGQVICADMLHPHYISQAAEKKIDLLLVPSFDAIFFTPLITFGSGYRAVENGFTMVRIAGDGHSAVIDPYYRHWAGQNSFEQGSQNFYARVPVVSHTTFYAIIGFTFPYIISFLLILLIVLAVKRAVKKN